MAGELTPEEIEARRGGLGGSDAGPVFGYGYGTPFTTWVNKVYGSTVEVTPQMQRGHDLEHVVADKAASRLGLNLFPVTGPIWSKSPEHPWLFATLDYVERTSRLLVRPSYGVECKTAMHHYAGHEWGPDDSGPDGVPPHVLLQAHQQLTVCPWLERAIVAVLFVDTWELRTYVIEPHPELAELLVEGERMFWEGHVLTRIPPAITSPIRDLEAARQIPAGAPPVALDDDARAHLEAWAEANEVATEADKRRKAAQAELARLIGEADGATLAGVDAVSATTNQYGCRVYRLKNKQQWRTTT